MGREKIDSGAASGKEQAPPSKSYNDLFVAGIYVLLDARKLLREVDCIIAAIEADRENRMK